MFIVNDHAQDKPVSNLSTEEMKKLLTNLSVECASFPLAVKEIEKCKNEIDEKNSAQKVSRLVEKMYQLQLVHEVKFSEEAKSILKDLSQFTDYWKTTWSPFFMVASSIGRLFDGK